MYAIIEDNKVTEYPIVNLVSRFPNTSFPDVIDDSNLPHNIVLVQVDAVPYYNPTTHKPVLNTEVIFHNNQWRQVYDIIPLSEQALMDAIYTQEQHVRNKRNALLTECDWTQIIDALVDKPAWAEYRQALRDITNQSGFPSDNLIWPTKPQ